MLPFAFCFFIGDVFLQSFSRLPGNYFIFLTLGLSVFIWFVTRKYFVYSYLFFAFVLGWAITAWYANSLLSWSLDKAQEGKTLLIKGHIASLPTTDPIGSHFVFSCNRFQLGKNQCHQVLVHLTWRNILHPLIVGDEWQLTVRLKRIHSVQNPGTFDFEALALQKGWRATGYVVVSEQNQRLDHHYLFHPIDQLRQQLQLQIINHLPNSSASPWLLALILGERNNIPQEDWRILRLTGTNHLMAIAGLHIGLLSFWIHHSFSWCWRRSERLLLLMPANEAGAIAALGSALLYSAMAGYSLPTQRAAIMFTIYLLGLLLKRKVNAWHSFGFALFLILMINPLNVLTESFWLSFGTIALIIYGMGGRLNPKNFWWKWGRVQWVISLGLIPLSLWLFQECSLISFVANSIAIPWLGFLILPFCFLATLFLWIPFFADGLLFIAAKSLTILWSVLTFFSHLHFASWQYAETHLIVIVIAFIGVLLLLLPKGAPARWLGLVWLVPLFIVQPMKPSINELWFTLLDVGQGLSAVLKTKNHLLVYDAGPKFNGDFDMGERVLIPYLRTLGAKKIDMLVISHGDNDHIGGAQSLLQAFPFDSIMTSVPEKLKTPFTQKCLAGKTWEWDGVQFKFLYPYRETLNLGNDSSCVLRVTTGNKSILLTGDIEKFAEKKLLQNVNRSLLATILIAPHHGSKTSGLKNFIHQVKPQYVLYGLGYRNRYHFPHTSVVKAYEEINAQQLNTADAGAIQFKLNRDELMPLPHLYRIMKKKYWIDH